MKKKTCWITFVALATLLGSGCKKALQGIFDGFDADVPEIVVTIPGPPVPIPVGTPVPTSEIAFPSYTQYFNLDSAIKSNTNGAFGAGDVHSVKIKKIIFALSNGDEANNFSNFASTRVTLYSDANTTPAQVADLAFPDVFDTTATFTAPAGTPELRGYLGGSALTYTAYGKIRRYPSKAMKLSVQVTLTVK